MSPDAAFISAAVVANLEALVGEKPREIGPQSRIHQLAVGMGDPAPVAVQMPTVVKRL